MIPPSKILVSANERGLPGTPFSEKNVYLTLECEDHNLFDELYLEIKAFAPKFTKRDPIKLRTFGEADKCGPPREFT